MCPRIADLSKERDEGALLHTMGSEAANVHLGSKRQVAHILRDLRHRKSNWLRSAAKDMARAMGGDWKKYRDSWGQRRFIKSTPFPINCESPTLRSEVQAVSYTHLT